MTHKLHPPSKRHSTSWRGEFHPPDGIKDGRQPQESQLAGPGDRLFCAEASASRPGQLVDPSPAATLLSWARCAALIARALRRPGGVEQCLSARRNALGVVAE